MTDAGPLLGVAARRQLRAARMSRNAYQERTKALVPFQRVSNPFEEEA